MLILVGDAFNENYFILLEWKSQPVPWWFTFLPSSPPFLSISLSHMKVQLGKSQTRWLIVRLMEIIWTLAQLWGNWITFTICLRTVLCVCVRETAEIVLSYSHCFECVYVQKLQRLLWLHFPIAPACSVKSFPARSAVLSARVEPC